jgi:hypothetical protein
MHNFPNNPLYVTWSPDGTTLAVVDQTSALHIVDARKCKPVKTHKFNSEVSVTRGASACVTRGASACVTRGASACVTRGASACVTRGASACVTCGVSACVTCAATACTTPV